MAFGIAIMGLNGSGKTTLAKCLAAMCGCYYMDAENYYFAPSDTTYSHALTQEEAERRVLCDIAAHESFVFSSVSLNYSDEVKKRISLAVILEAPFEARMRRIRARSFGKFGSRMLPGGDLYESEEAFFAFAARRTMHKTEAAAKGLACPVLRLSGLNTPEENAKKILAYSAERHTNGKLDHARDDRG